MPPVRPTVGELERSLSEHRVETNRRFLAADVDRQELRQDMRDQKMDFMVLVKQVVDSVSEINSRSRNTMLLVILAIMSSLIFPLLVGLVLRALLK